MYSLPSTSHTCAPCPRRKNLGETPSTNCEGALLSVCVPPGITRWARSHSAAEAPSERVAGGELACTPVTVTAASRLTKCVRWSAPLYALHPGVSRIGCPAEFPALSSQTPEVVELVP